MSVHDSTKRKRPSKALSVIGDLDYESDEREAPSKKPCIEERPSNRITALRPNISYNLFVIATGDITSNKSKSDSVASYSFFVTDASERSIRVVCWRSRPSLPMPLKRGTILSLKGAKVNVYNGIYTLTIKPENVCCPENTLPRVQALERWWDEFGGDLSISPLFEIAPFPDVVEKIESEDGTGKSFFVTQIRLSIGDESISYESCEKCAKKTQRDGNAWYCEKCKGKTELPYYRYLLKLRARDGETERNMSAFDSFGLEFFKKTANEMQEIAVCLLL